jgi:uncharacterized protein (TIGR00297 family)
MYERLIELLEMPSYTEWVRLLFVSTGLILCVVVGELIRKHFHWTAEVTRKFVHISVGIIIFFAPQLFHTALIPLGLAFIAVCSMAIAVRKGLLVGMHGTTRFSYGTMFYPLSFFILIILFWNKYPEIISLSMFGLAIGDATAAIVGESLRHPKIFYLTSDKKSIEGSMTMFIVSNIVLLCGMYFLGLFSKYTIGYLFITALCTSLITTIWEALSSKGFDNFTVPMSIAFALYYFLVPTPLQNIEQFQYGILLSLGIAFLSYYFRFLSISGSAATILLASTIFGIGGWKWTIPILVFFIFSSILSKIGKGKKQHIEHIFEKSSTRDWGQVAANGGIAGLIVLLQYFFQDFNFYPYYIGAIAAVTADTWGTEIGIWFQWKTVSISCLKIVEPGTNGGVSLIGFLGGVLGAFIVAISSVYWLESRLVLIAVYAGFFGSLVDSWLGGTLQATYRCTKCNKITERQIHCVAKTEFYKGIQWCNNDVVNWICAFSGAIFPFLYILVCY